LRITLDRIDEEAVECGEQFRQQFVQMKIADQIGGLRYDIVVAMAQCLAQRFDYGLGLLAT